MSSDQPSPVRERLWRPALLVAAASAATATLLSLLCAAVARQPGMGVGDTAGLAGALLTGTYVAPASFSGGFMIRGHLAATPLTLTIVTLAVTVLVFRRTTARVGSAAAGLRVAGVGAALTALAAFVLTLLLALGGVMHATGATWVHGMWVAGEPWGAALGALLTVFVVLGGAVLWRRDWHGPRMRPVGDLVRPLLAGVGVLVVLLPLAGLVTGLAGGLSATHPGRLVPDGDLARAGVVGAVAYSANAGVWALVLGAGGRVGVLGFEHVLGLAANLGVHLPGPGRLGHYAGSGLHQPGLWVAVAVTPLVLALAAYAAVRVAGRRRLAGVGLWAAGHLVVVPLLVVAANGRLAVHTIGIDATGGFGAVWWDAALLLAAYALVVGGIVLVGWSRQARPPGTARPPAG